MQLYLLWEMGIVMIMIAYCGYFIHRYIKIYTHTKIGSIWECLAISFSIVIIFYIWSFFLSFAMFFMQLLCIICILEVLYSYFKKNQWFAFLHTTGILLLIVIISLVIYNDYKMDQVVQKTYTLKSNKIDTLRILQITDLHMSHQMNIEQIEEYCQKMNTLNIDMVVLTGDIFEEKTPYKDMKEVIKILSTIKNRLGIYYIYGNHDDFSAMDNKGYSREDIKKILEINQITVLEDSVVTVNNVTIIGRKNKGLKQNMARKDIEELVRGVDLNSYVIVLDHQPLELEKNATLGIDLQLSGHTHGGYGYPLEYIESIFERGLVYGRKTIHNFTAITSSGISFSKRTGAPNEYVYIVINKE